MVSSFTLVQANWSPALQLGSTILSPHGPENVTDLILLILELETYAPWLLTPNLQAGFNCDPALELPMDVQP